MAREPPPPPPKCGFMWAFEKLEGSEKSCTPRACRAAVQNRRQGYQNKAASLAFPIGGLVLARAQNLAGPGNS